MRIIFKQGGKVMDKHTLDLLTEEIERMINEIKDLDVGSEEYRRASESLTKLYSEKTKIELEMAKLEMEDLKHADDVKVSDVKNEIEKKKARNAFIGDLIKTGVTLGLGVGAIAFKKWGLKGSWDFEKTDSYSSTTSRSIFQELFKK